MSLVSVVSTLDGIAMSADSRISVPFNLGEEQLYVPVSERGEKILTIRNGTVGVVFTGDLVVENETTADLVREFDRKYIKKKHTIQAIAQKIELFLIEKLLRDKIQFFIAGYDKKEQYIFHIGDKGINRLNYCDKEKGFVYSWWIAGDTDIIEHAFRYFEFAPVHTPIDDAIEISRFMIDFGAKYQLYNKQISTTIGGALRTLKIKEDETKFFDED